QLKAVPQGGDMHVRGDELFITGADAVTLYFAAATNFVSYKDVSGNQVGRVNATLDRIDKRPYRELRVAAVADHQSYFRRARLELDKTANSVLPTDERMAAFASGDDPSLAALAYNFGRYLLISSSRPGTEAANLQGIWNESQNPMWDSKYTTNINTEMNYWPVESGNLSDCAEPLIT
ncbi:MAG: glycoside hydrolase family 95 protein, partial [bacterium]|nr:glycoside hydrolase family 95 protein [bacterium]